jgi:hypothetical protein
VAPRGGLDRADEGGLVADIGLHWLGLAAARSDARHHLVQRLLAPAAYDHHRAFLGETRGRGRAYARAAPGDEGHLALQSSCHLVVSFRGFRGRRCRR